MNLRVDTYLSPWIKTNDIRDEFVEDTVRQIKKSGKKSTRKVREDINSFKEVIAKVEEEHKNFGLRLFISFNITGYINDIVS